MSRTARTSRLTLHSRGLLPSPSGHSGVRVDAASLKERGVISRIDKDGIKVLGNGEIGHALTIKAAKFTKSAAEKIAAAGGTAEVI